MKEIMIIIHVYVLYQTLLSCIQLIFVFLIFKYVEKLLKSRLIASSRVFDLKSVELN